MRTSKDEYILQDGEIIGVSQSEQPPQGARLWNGYDYKNQCWMYRGEKDTRTLEELKTAANYICTWCKNGEHIECEADMCACKH